ncbi:MAG: hypothetical protein AAFO15_01645, partial [Pseudomonadota bacterium]
MNGSNIQNSMVDMKVSDSFINNNIMMEELDKKIQSLGKQYSDRIKILEEEAIGLYQDLNDLEVQKNLIEEQLQQVEKDRQHIEEKLLFSFFNSSLSLSTFCNFSVINFLSFSTCCNFSS